ncbi:SUZ domain-containing protein 1 [Asbolus verrucosus]|uniref:SUZ RNA-binding domain-containing n=1 Tax=Asbolus verrucosus TaxID=1661398 RepID=A0A482VKU3_ASBVE|nr:SUZ domain-containing protein 1 [Asbolus verrucosus]
MASKQQEVEVLESWEEIEETDVLEEKFKSIIPPSNNGITVPFKILLTGDDALRSQYVPPEPTVKILKRPSKESHNTNNDSKVYQPKKTLQQRKQEYAEARLRILGETEKTEEKISIVQSKARSADVENVIRYPKGPDGTKGFNIRR